ncbi:bifunctional adenosylcobinamide kinase/adenosylcobinamide-phosphate guanylyltransferase [Chloroflexota bacterium]
MGKLTLILGGARSGKSSFAQQVAEESAMEVVYIATARAIDEEMIRRIEKHKQERPKDWKTLEIPISLAERIKKIPIKADIVILDCLTVLVNNIFIENTDDVDNPDQEILEEKGFQEVKDLLSTIKESEADWLVVSNEVGFGLVPPYPIGRLYRDVLGGANKLLAKEADEVILIIAGIPMKLQPM